VRLLPLALLAILAAGCTPGRIADAPPTGTAAGFPNHTAVQVRALVEASVARVTSYRSEARLETVINGRDLDVTASLRARLADTLFAVVRGPLGIEGGRGVITADSLFALDRLRGRYYVGPVAVAERYVPGASRPGRLARALLGLEAPPATADWRISAQGTRYILTSPDGAQTWVVDPRLWRAVAVEERAADGRRITRSYEQFETVAGVGGVAGIAVPRRVVMASPDDTASLTVDHRSVTLNPDDLSFPFPIPRDAELVRIR